MIVENRGIMGTVAEERDEDTNWYGEHNIVVMMILEKGSSVKIASKLRQKAPQKSGRNALTHPISNQTPSNEHGPNDRRCHSHHFPKARVKVSKWFQLRIKIESEKSPSHKSFGRMSARKRGHRKHDVLMVLGMTLGRITTAEGRICEDAGSHGSVKAWGK